MPSRTERGARSVGGAALWLLGHPYMALAFRLYIGGLFVYASMYKINFAAEFAETIASYRIVPWWGVNALAVTLPWIELTAGGCLALGLRGRSAALILGGLLAVFTLAIVVNLARGSDISCGCFHTLEDPISWRTVLRDLTWLGMTAHVYVFDRALQLDRLFLKGFREAQA